MSGTSRKTPQQGLTLIELMIALALSAFLLLGVLKVFDANRQSSNVQNAFGRLQESGRMAMEFVRNDIRNADYWGCVTGRNSIDGGDINVLLDVTNPPPDQYNFLDPSGAITGVENASGLELTDKNGVTIQIVDGTDVLVLRGAWSLSNVAIEAPYMNTNAAALHITKFSGIDAGDILLVSDCSAGELFQNTSGNTNTSGTVGHNTGTGSPGNKDKNFSKTYGQDAMLSIPYINYTFVALGTTGLPTLYRMINYEFQELVAGVEDLQYMYGVDSNDDGSVDLYQNADDVEAAGDWELVRSIQATMQVRAEDPTDSSEFSFDDGKQPGTPYTDKRLRKLYTTVTNIRNRTMN